MAYGRVRLIHDGDDDQRLSQQVGYCAGCLHLLIQFLSWVSEIAWAENVYWAVARPVRQALWTRTEEYKKIIFIRLIYNLHHTATKAILTTELNRL